MEPSSYG